MSRQPTPTRGAAPRRWLGLAVLGVAAAQAQVQSQVQGPPAEPMVAYAVSEGDTLIGLSRTLWATPEAWREVARLNQLPNPDRLRPGQVLQVPARLLRSRDLPAELAVVQGEVRVRAADGTERAAVAGTPWVPGETLITGATGSAVVRLADGSRVQAMPGTQLTLGEHRRYATRASPAEAAPQPAEQGWFAGTMRLLQGGLDVLASTLRRAKPLEVQTPTAVIGVRGTQYRVRQDGQADEARASAEVLQGTVAAQAAGTPGSATAALAAGFGARLRAGAAPEVRELLSAPPLQAVPPLFERPVVRFALPDETTPLRVQVAADEAFDQLVLDTRVEPGAEVRLAGLADGTWQLRARRVDAIGLEGLDSRRAFVLKARPEPPATLQPRPGGKAPAGPVRLAWAQNLEAARYRVEVARDAAFRQDVRQLEAEGTEAQVVLDTPGEVHWRVRSLRADGDLGPWGDAQRFELRPLPEPAAGGLGEDGRSLRFAWSARAQDRQQVELARDEAFTDVIARADLAEGRWTPPDTGPGRVYFRYRAVEPDGYVSPWSSTLAVDVPRLWRPRWLFAPLLGGEAP